jgi:hypothetical protein
VNTEFIERKVEEMGNCMSKFPKNPDIGVRIGEMLGRMIGTADVRLKTGVVMTPEMRLEWLVTAMIEDVGVWPDGGMKELRGLYCSKFPPADGKEVVCSLPGFSPEDAEAGNVAPSLMKLRAPEVPQKYLPEPGDEPIGDDLTKKLAEVVERKRIAAK